MSDSNIGAIWKYPILGPTKTTWDMPEGTKPLCVQLQGGVPTLWAQAVPGTKKVRHKFNVVGTGHPYPIDEVGSYVGTWQLDGLAWHLFDAGELPL